MHQTTKNFNTNLMQLVLGRYDYKVTRNSNFSVQNKQSCQEILNCSNFRLIITNLPKFQRKLVYLISPMSFKLFSEHSCQVVDHRAPKLPRTGNSFNSFFFPKKLLDFYKMS